MLSLSTELSETKTESALALEWNLSVKELAAKRQAYLRKGYHYQYIDFEIHYTLSGITELLRWVTPIATQNLPEPERPRVRCLPNDYPLSEKVVEVIRIWGNPRLVVAQRANGAKVSLWVKSNKKFRKGMRVNLETQCKWMGQHTDLPRYEFLDNLPRFWGRW